MVMLADAPRVKYDRKNKEDAESGIVENVEIPKGGSLVDFFKG